MGGGGGLTVHLHWRCVQIGVSCCWWETLFFVLLQSVGAITKLFSEDSSLYRNTVVVSFFPSILHKVRVS